MIKVANIPGEKRAKILTSGDDISTLPGHTTDDPLYVQAAQFADQINSAKKVLYEDTTRAVCPYLASILANNCIIINPVIIENTKTNLLSVLKGEFDRLTTIVGQHISNHYGVNFYNTKSKIDLFVMMSPVLHPQAKERGFCEEMTLQYNLQRMSVIEAGHMIADVNPFRESGGGGITNEEQEADSYFKNDDGSNFMFMFKHLDATDDQFMRTPEQVTHHFTKYPELKEGFNPFRQAKIAHINAKGINKHIAEGYEILESVNGHSNPLEIINKLYERCLYDTPEEEIRRLIQCFHRDIGHTKDYLYKRMGESERKYRQVSQDIGFTS